MDVVFTANVEIVTRKIYSVILRKRRPSRTIDQTSISILINSSVRDACRSGVCSIGACRSENLGASGDNAIDSSGSAANVAEVHNRTDDRINIHVVLDDGRQRTQSTSGIIDDASRHVLGRTNGVTRIIIDTDAQTFTEKRAKTHCHFRRGVFVERRLHGSNSLASYIRGFVFYEHGGSADSVSKTNAEVCASSSKKMCVPIQR